MSSVKHLREFILERLTAAAEEIFSEVEKNIIQYEVVIDQQRKLLESSWKPAVQLHDSDVSPQHAFLYKEDHNADQILCNQADNSQMIQEEPKSLQIKKELDNLTLEEEELLLKHETESFSNSPTHEDDDHTDHKLNRDGAPTYNFAVDEPSLSEESHHEDKEPTQSTELNSDKVPEKDIEYVQSSLPLGSHADINHTTEKLFICHTCDKRFRHLHSLEKHMTVHFSDKSRVYKSKFSVNNVIQHVRNHSGEKPFSCKMCGTSFSRNSNLLRHMRTHSGEKPYSCAMCEKSFTRNSHLLRHIRTHREDLFIQNMEMF